MNRTFLLGDVGMMLKGFGVRAILSFVLCGFAVGQASAGSGPQLQPAAAPTPSSEQQATDSNYIIGNSDVIEINVWEKPALTETVPVRSDGKISMPLIGEVQASGLTPLQLKAAITEKLRAYLTVPDVIVVVQQMNSQRFNILGRVMKPGSYPLLATTTVLDAIAGAGGPQDFAKQKSIYILRRNAYGREIRIPFNYKDVIRGTHPEQNIKLQPNDTIIVP
jgi:polysaccharide biosynthesis/export protein